MDKYAIIRRAYEDATDTNKLDLLATADDIDSATTLAKAVRGNAGDIIIVCDLNDVSDLINRVSLMFVLDENGVTHELPNVEEFTGRQTSNWIKLWEYDEFSAEGAFWTCFDCSVDRQVVSGAVYECVHSFVVTKSDRFAAIMSELMDGKIDDDKASEYIINIQDERIKTKLSYKERLALDPVLHSLRSVYDYSHTPSALTACGESRITDSFIEVFRRRIPTRDLLLSLVKSQLSMGPNE